MDTAPTWAELLFLMVHGSDRPMRGRIHHHDGEEATSFAFSHAEGDPPPTFVHGGGDVIDVWCWGDRLRVADPDGHARLITDGTTAWSFTGADEPPGESPYRNVAFGMSGTDLLVRSTAEEWLGDDFAHPTGPPAPTVFLGRDAWAIELAPPDHKPHPMQLVIDAETGMLLQQRNDAFGLVREWVELTVGEDLDPALFTWTGPVLTWEAQRARSRREMEEENAERARWAVERLGTRRLTLTIEVEVDVNHIDEDGSLHASLSSIAALTRRPRSDAAGDGVHEVDDEGEMGRGDTGTHRWRDSAWDWSLRTWEVSLAPGTLADVQAQLRP